ncbi:hypothetical protein HKD37_02G004929 [Glycine soja]
MFTYKTNNYRLLLLDIVGVTPIGIPFSATFAYLEGEHHNNVGLFLRRDALSGVIITDRDLALMNAVKIVFPECTNLLCRFHIDKNFKAKCKSLFDDCLKKFEIVCSPSPMFVDYVNQTLIIPHKEKFVKAWTNKVMHLGNKTTYRYENCMFATEFERVHYAGKNPSRCGCVMRTTHGLPCACEPSRYVVGTIPLETIHMFWRKLSFLDQGLSEPEVNITKEMEIISKRFEELDVCGKVTLKSKLQEIAYPDLNSMCPPPEKVNTKGAQKKPMTKHQRSTKCDPSYWEYVDTLHYVQNSNSSVKSSASSSKQAIPRRNMPMLDQFHSCIHDSIENVVDVKVDGNYGYRTIVVLLGMCEDSWSLVRNHLFKELAKWFDEYINLGFSVTRVIRVNCYLKTKV